jgi:hypothetical protein
MEIYILRENVLSDDTLKLPSEGKIFTGNYIAIVEYNTYQNEWSDRKQVKRFRKRASLDSFLSKHYPEFKH